MAVDTPNEWFRERADTFRWAKWRLARDAGVLALADAVLAGEPPPDPGPEPDPVLAGLTALAAGDPDRAERVLAAAADAGQGLADVALADVHAAKDDWSVALFAAELATRRRPGEPIGTLATAFALLATGAPSAAADVVRPLRAALPADALVADHLALALLLRAEAARARTRAGRSLIISATQLAECRVIATELGSAPIADADLREQADALAAQVRAGGRWEWRQHGTNVGVLVSTLLVSLAVIVVAGLFGNVSVVVAGILLGGAGVYLFVLTHRRPAWELRAQDFGALLARRGG